MTPDQTGTTVTDIAARLAREPDGRTVAGTLLDTAAGLLRPAPFRVVVCGEFEVGKSSLLNALVSRPGLFPNDPNEITGVVTTLAYGSEPAARIARSARSGGRTTTAPLEQVQRYVTEPAVPAARHGGDDPVVLVEMWAPLERLAGGVELVDTPGLGSANGAHTLSTMTFLDHADLLVFVTQVGRPLSVPELDALEEAVGADRPFVCVVSKCDLVEDPERYLTAARRRIADRLGRTGEELVVLPLSATLASRADRTGSVADRAESNVDELWRWIDTGHERWTGARTAAAVPYLVEAIDRIAAPLRARAADLVAAERRLGELQRMRAEAPALVRREVAAAVDAIRADARARFDALRAEVGDGTELFSARLDPDDYVARFSEAVRDARTASGDALAKVHDRLVEDWSRRTRVTIDLAPPGTDRGPMDALPLLDRREQPRWFTVSAIRRAAGAVKAGGVLGGGLGGSLAAVLSAMVGGVVTPVVGAGVGLLVGQLAAWVAGLTEVRAQARQDFRAARLHELSTRAPDWVDHFREREDGWLDQAAAELSRELTEALRAGWVELDELLRQARQARDADAGTAVRDGARLARLDAWRRQLDGLGGLDREADR